MKKLVFLIFLCSKLLQAQVEHAWVYFKDKPNASTFLENPSLMLTQKALDRRSRQSISVDIKDVPLFSNYVSQVSSSMGITVKARSKWLNALHVLGTQTAISNLQNLESVDSIQFANKDILNINPPLVASQEKITQINKLKSLEVYNYGNSENQTSMLEVDVFHNAGFDGEGLTIAIMDGGFSGVNTAGAFSHLVDTDYLNGEVLGGFDYVNNSSNFYANTGSTHGTQVLSTIGAVKENQFIGIAPKASYYLFVTEDVTSETPLEESLWVQAAEKADSLGVDILNTSLGYNEFDESKYNYTYADMDGKTTFISRGAAIAAQKGMVVVNSAGNSGNDSWHYITAPADADGIITVGAVNGNESLTFFSSFGPTSDARIKPETLAQGGSVYVVDENDIVKMSNGTSFSGPIIAGVSACLWQAFPNKSSVEIRQMIIENSEDFLAPTNQGGYGVLKIGNLINQLSLITYQERDESDFSVLFSDQSNLIIFQFFKAQETPLSVQVYSPVGTILENKQILGDNNQININDYANGIYYLQYHYKGENKLMVLYKID